MKREFLKSLGLAEDAIDKIMDENGKDINDHKAKAEAAITERNELKTQLEKRDADITELKKTTGDKDEWVKKATDLEAKYKADTEALTAKLDRQAFDAKIDLALAGKVKNVKAVKALLDADKIKLKDNDLDGLEPQLTALKTSDPYLFNDAGKPKGTTPPAGGPGGTPPAQVSFRDAIASSLSAKQEKAV